MDWNNIFWVIGESDEADSENQEVAGRCDAPQRPMLRAIVCETGFSLLRFFFISGN